MKKMILAVVFLGVILGLGIGYRFYLNPRPLLTEEGQNFQELYQSLNQSRVDLAELKGLIEAKEKAIAEQEQILQVGKVLVKTGRPIVIDSVSYPQEQVNVDLARRERDNKFLRQTVDSNKVYQGKLEDIIASLAERITKIRINFNEAEAIKAELAALADYQLLNLSEIKAARDEELPTLLARVNGDFEEKLEQIKKSQRIDLFPDVLEENFIATSSWLKQAAIYRAEQAEVKKRKEIEEQQRRQAEADQQRKALEEETLKQAEAEKQRKIVEEERRRQAEAESKRKAAEEQQRQQAEAEEKQRQQAEAERQRKAVEEQRHQAEVERKQKQAEEQKYQQAEAEKQRKAAEEEETKQAEAERKKAASLVFKTIKIGTGLKTANDFRAAMDNSENFGPGRWGRGKPLFKITKGANDILNKAAFTVADQQENVDLVVLTVAQLTGKSTGGTIKEVFAGAARLGLDKCSLEDGPQLRLQYLDQPNNNGLLIGMNPITTSDGAQVFHIERTDFGFWLDANHIDPGFHWPGGVRWVFRCRKTAEERKYQ